MVASRRYNYVRARLLENTLPGDPKHGTWNISYNRTQFGWGQVPEAAYPGHVDTSTYFAPIPPAADVLAKPGRIHHYFRVRSAREARKIAKQNPDFLEIVRHGGEMPPPDERLDLKVAFEYTRQFVEAPMGRIVLPDSGAPILGSHSVPIMGLSEANRVFVISNSWGPAWGYYSLGDMPFEFFDRFMIESWAVDETSPALKPGKGDVEFHVWETRDPLGDGTPIHGIEVYDPRHDDRIGWSFVVHRDGFLDIEELFVKPAYRGQGYGGQLVDRLLGLATQRAQPLRAWIPYVDAGEANRPALGALLKKLGLGVHRSGVGWAAYVATQDQPQPASFPFVRIPAPPAAAQDQAQGLPDVETLHGTVLKYDHPFAPAIEPEEWEAVRDSP
jgi:GNAT superfamily N-acetyltransferase